VTGSSLAFNWPMVHDGVIRRSEEEFSDVIWRGMSPAACMLMLIVAACDVDLIRSGRSEGQKMGCAVRGSVLDLRVDSAIEVGSLQKWLASKFGSSEARSDVLFHGVENNFQLLRGGEVEEPGRWSLPPSPSNASRTLQLATLLPFQPSALPFLDLTLRYIKLQQ